MMLSVTQYFKLAWLILRKGELNSAGIDFNKRRWESLIGLLEFVPPSYSVYPIKSETPNHSILQNLIGQAAFIKNAFKLKGGHLKSPSLNLCYVRIPKSASTSMSLAMLENRYPDLRNKTVTEEQINFITDANLENSTVSDASATFFTIVRNPFARLVSVYHDFFENKSDFIYNDYLFGILPPSLSFSEFVDRLAIIPDSLKDQHLKPQSKFLNYYKKNSLRITILKLEESDKANAFLMKHSLQLPHLNKRNKDYRYQDYYTQSILQKVNDIYGQDIQKFGYQNAYSELLETIKSGKTI